MKIFEIIKLLVAYPGKIIKWLADGRYHLLTLTIPGITILYFIKTITFQPKIVSALFLVFGLAIIIWQLIGDAKNFSNSNPNTLKNWFNKVPPIKPRTLKTNVSSTGVITTAGKAHLRVSISKDASVEEKVNFLMKQKEEIETSVINLEDKFDDKVSEMNNKIKELDTKIEETENIINSTISDITIGNYDLRLLSVVLMICGTFLQILI